MDRKLLVGFSTLFWGQTHCYFDLGQMKTIWKPLTTSVFEKHLKGELELGVYCTNDQAMSYWGCVDFDSDKTKAGDSRAYQAALQLQGKYEEYGITSWIERSRSKGYHVWIFPKGPMPSRTLRKAQLSCLESLGMSGLEVNPKQETLYDKSKTATAPSNRGFGIGNLVRIPYSPLAMPNRMVCLSRGMGLPLATFASEAMETRPDPTALAKLGRPGERHTGPVERRSGAAGSAGQNQEAYEIWKGDLTIGKGERDNQFYTLTKLLKANGLLYVEACETIQYVYEQKVLDKRGFSLDDALAKVRREYGR